MSVLIKGMEMPRGCYDCTLESICGRWAKHDAEWQKGNRDKDCPLIPVPPHGDLIDKQVADELNKQDYEAIGSDRYTDYARSVVLNCLNAAPIIIPADHIGDVNEMVGDS